MNAKQTDCAWLRKGWLDFFYDGTGITNGKRCKLCGKVVKSTAVATSNFARHLRMHHGDKLTQYNAIETKHVTTVTDNSKQCKTSTSSVSETRKTEIDSALVEFFIVDLECLQIERRQALQRLLHVAAPGYTMPDQQTVLHALLPRKVQEFKSAVANLISSCQHIGVTLDIWSSRATMLFMGVTVHVIPPNMVPETAVLCCKYVPGEHSGQTIGYELKKLLEETMISHKVGRVLADSGPNMAQCFKLPCFELSWKSESEQLCQEREAAIAEFDNDANVDVQDLRTFTIDRVPCAAHMLQLVVQEGLKSDARIAKLIGKVSSICAAIRKSSVNAEVQQLFMKFNLTEWNQQVQIIHLYVRIAQSAPSLLEQDQMNVSPNELQQLAELCDLLGAFDHALKILQSQVASSGALIPTLCALWLHLRDIKGKSQCTTTVCGQMMMQLRHLFGSHLHDSTWLTCAVLDPRFRIAFCKPIEGFVDYNLEEVRKIVFSECKKAHAEYNVRSDSQTDANSTDLPEVKPSFFSCVLTSESDRGHAVSCTDDLALLAQFDSYVCAAVTDCDADIFAYIRTRAMVDFPRLIPAWRKFLCIPVTSAPIKCLFSTASDITTHGRCARFADVIENLDFLKRNMKLSARIQNEPR